MRIKIRKSFGKDIDKITDKKLLQKIITTIQEIENSENIQDVNNVKKMKGKANAFRIRLGQYRIGMFCINNEVELVRILQRKDIYKYFPQ